MSDMKLYLLRPKENLPKDDNPWNPWYDKTFGMVIRAKCEDSARAIGNEDSSGDEKQRYGNKGIVDINPWLDKSLSDCTEITYDGEEGVILVDFRSA